MNPAVIASIKRDRMIKRNRIIKRNRMIKRNRGRVDKIITAEIPAGKPFILQTARIYSKAAGKSTLLAICSRDSLQVLMVCSIYSHIQISLKRI